MVEKVLELGKGSLLAKVDIEHAYRNVPVHPDDRLLLAMQWDGIIYLDLVLPFGLRSAPKIFSALADAVEWILLEVGVMVILHYLDDFLTMGQKETDQCATNLRSILGLPIERKAEGPTVVIVFLGIILVTRNMELRLPTNHESQNTCKQKDRKLQ